MVVAGGVKSLRVRRVPWADTSASLTVADAAAEKKAAKRALCVVECAFVTGRGKTKEAFPHYDTN